MNRIIKPIISELSNSLINRLYKLIADSVKSKNTIPPEMQ